MQKLLISSLFISIFSLHLLAQDIQKGSYEVVIGTYKNLKETKQAISLLPKLKLKIIKKPHNYSLVVKERFTKDEALDLLNQIKDKAKNSYLSYKKNIEATHKDKKTLKEKPDTNNNIDTIQQTQTTLNPTQGLTLKDAILLALDNSYKIKAAKEKVIQAKEKINEKLAAFYPKLDLYANGGGAYLKPYQAKEVKFWKSDESLVLSQNIYAGSKHINELKRERENLKVALAKYRDKVEEESLKIIDAYLSLVFQKKAIDKANENMKNLEKILSIVQTKANSGAASKGDLNYIKSQVDNAKTALVQVESKYKNALSYYEYFLGKVDKSKMPIESRFDFSIGDYKEVLDATYRKNAKLQIAKSKLQAQKFDLQAKRSKYRPKLDLSITGKDKQSGYESEPQEDRATAMLQLSYNLYNGGKDKAIIAGAKSKIRALEYQLIDTKKGVKHNSEQLYENVRSTKESLKHTQDEVNANKKVIDSYWSAFKYGTQDLQALLLAQRALNRSQLDEIKQKQLYINSYFKLLKQTGELLKKIGIDSF